MATKISTGTLTVAAGITISGSGYGVEFTGSPAYVVNAGSIAGTSGQGVYLQAGGAVTNQAGGTITGLYESVLVRNGTATVVNAGNLAVFGYGFGVYVQAAGAVINQSSGTISGTAGIYFRNTAGTVTNYGRIAGLGGTGVQLNNGGIIDNRSGGTIYGSHLGVFIPAAVGTVINAGSIAGGVGVQLQADGYIANQASGTISGTAEGIYVRFAAATVVNYGSIGASGPSGTDVALSAGGTLINAGAIAGAALNGVYLNAGAYLINRSGGTISATGYGVIGGFSVAPVTIRNAGTIGGSQYAIKFIGIYGYANRVIVDPGAVFNGAVYGGPSNGTLELASSASAGTLTSFGTQFTNFGTLVFDPSAQWLVAGSAANLAAPVIAGFGSGGTLDVTDFRAVSDTFASGALTLTDSLGAHITLQVQGGFQTSDFTLAPDGAGGTDLTAICFLPGTLIRTLQGEVPVEKLEVGQFVRTWSGGKRPVTWIGTGTVLAARGRQTASASVIVRAGALADNVPSRDLRVTKGHSLWIDDVLIPVEFLVNHRSIVWNDSPGEVTIYHVELDAHDILIADGAPAESYRDDGNRWLFRNANANWDAPEKAHFAPVLTGGPVVDAAWRRLLDRCGPLPDNALTNDPDLHLLADGVRIDPFLRDHQRWTFALDRAPASLRIASRSAAPDVLGLARDPRLLGVAVTRIVAFGAGGSGVLWPHDPNLQAGWHALETDNRWRWTNGSAEVPAALFAEIEGAIGIELTVASVAQYPHATESGQPRAGVAEAPICGACSGHILQSA